ncbi:MAG TPA: leucyl/phenylalanyl-tRNA--protein transferase [Rhodothermales bacterium]|nr:leucyl/phenylalanyl-tRNA--protein transferase [Bacteroidota bacterium]HRK72803.1 leucyl/phenylalanyl-tRNA--protein transferase [Rhodothermales bacterium]HRR09000.1 leucyl/phenylalanyl-tRNA--protein transferase [Rhodothermales bacterium]
MKSEFLIPEVLLGAYTRGVFPMAIPEENNEIYWFSPDPRAIIPLDHRFHVSKTLAKTVRRNVFKVRLDQEFEVVMRACGHREHTWISEELVAAYVRLHQRGFAHSVTCWQDGQLVGGLYGVALGGAFFGESMFSNVRDASKVALVHLVAHLRNQGFILLDTQFITPHLARFGAYEIPRKRYLQLLHKALQLTVSWA